MRALSETSIGRRVDVFCNVPDRLVTGLASFRQGNMNAEGFKVKEIRERRRNFMHPDTQVSHEEKEKDEKRSRFPSSWLIFGFAADARG